MPDSPHTYFPLGCYAPESGIGTKHVHFLFSVMWRREGGIYHQFKLHSKEYATETKELSEDRRHKELRDSSYRNMFNAPGRLEEN